MQPGVAKIVEIVPATPAAAAIYDVVVLVDPPPDGLVLSEQFSKVMRLLLRNRLGRLKSVSYRVGPNLMWARCSSPIWLAGPCLILAPRPPSASLVALEILVEVLKRSLATAAVARERRYCRVVMSAPDTACVHDKLGRAGQS